MFGLHVFVGICLCCIMLGCLLIAILYYFGTCGYVESLLFLGFIFRWIVLFSCVLLWVR